MAVKLLSIMQPVLLIGMMMTINKMTSLIIFVQHYIYIYVYIYIRKKKIYVTGL